MAVQAESIVVLTESEKFTKHGTVPLNVQDSITTVITDQGIDDAVTAELNQEGIRVINADS